MPRENRSKRTSRPLHVAVLLLVVPAAAQVCGDCNQDTVLSVLDALRQAQIAVGLLTPGPGDLTVCDVDSDTDIDVVDSLQTAQAATGLPVTLTCTGTSPDPTLFAVNN